MLSITETIKGLIDFYMKKISPTEDDERQFEQNVRSNLFLKTLIPIESKIGRYEGYLGKKVYKKSRPNGTVDFSHVKYQIDQEDEPMVEFTKEILTIQRLSIVNETIEALKRDLLTEPLTYNSTSKMRNLIFEWEIETKQKLISTLEIVINSQIRNINLKSKK
jgi:hypothetical protein